MSQGKIRIEMELDGNNFTYQVNKIEQSLTRLENRVTSTSKSVDKIEKHITSFGQALKDFTLTVSMAHGAIMNLHGLTTKWMYSIVQTNAEIERMTYLMKGMSNAIDEGTRMKEAKDNVQWLFDFAKTAPFSMGEVTNAFVKFKSVGIDPTNGSLRALTDAVAAFGGNDQILHRASVAIQQMAGKGVISMEELRQQLGEAVPTAINMMARSMGMSYGQLVEKISKGTVEAKNALANMFAEFERTYGGRGQAMMTTFSGLVARLNTEWMEFQKRVGDTGYFDEAKKGVADLIALLNSPMAMSFAQDLGESLTSVASFLRESIKWVVEWRREIGTAIQAVIASFILLKTHQAVTSIALMFGQIGMSIASFGTHIKTSGGLLAAFTPNMITAAKSGQDFATAMKLDALALATVGRAMWNLIPVIGTVIAVVFTLADAFDVFGRKARDSFEEAKKGVNAFLDAKQLAEAKDILDKTKKELEAAKVITPREKDPATHAARLAADSDYAISMKRIGDLEKLVKDSGESIARIEAKNGEQAAKSFADNKLFETQKQLGRIESEYDKTMLEIIAQRDKKALSQEEFDKKRSEEAKKRLDSERDLYKKAISDAEEARLKATDPKEIAGFQEVVKRAQAELVRLDGSYMATASGTLTQIEKQAKGVDKLTSKLNQLKEAQAKGQAKIDGTGVARAELEAEILAGQYKNASAFKLSQLRSEADKLDEITRKKRIEADLTKQIEQSMENITRSYDKEIDKAGTLREELLNPNLASSSKGQRTFEAGLREQLGKIPEGSKERAEAERKVSEAIAEYNRNEVRSYVISMRDKTQAARTAVMERKEALESEYQYEVEKVYREAELNKLAGEERIAAEEQISSYLEALARKHARDMEGPIEQMLRKWKDASQQMQEAGARWLDDFTDRLVDFTITGKATFKDFALSVVKDILKIQMQAQIAKFAGGGLLDSVLGGIGKWIGGQFGSGGYNIGAGSTANTGITPGVGGQAQDLGSSGLSMQFHTGGVVGLTNQVKRLIDPSVFSNAQKYHSGGWVGDRHLASDEIPIIARKGEGVFTEEQMRAMGGGANVQINVINQSGQNVTAQKGEPRFDGEKMILDIVLKNAASPGSFRDGLKGALSK